MKLITAVIGKKDLNPVCDVLREAGYSFTKIPTSGGFLRSSNMTLLIGVDDDKLAPCGRADKPKLQDPHRAG